ncbi:MAG: FCD domain-containing protein [Geminicoccaceae bacterium]
MVVAITANSRENSSRALNALRHWLSDDGMRPGERLPPERELAERLGVGRRALRRALDVLETEGRIWRQQGKGTFVGDMPYPEEPAIAEIAANAGPHDIMVARLCIEPELAACSAQNAEPADIVRMRHLAGQIDATRDPDAAELWDGALHRLIARSSGNPLLVAAFALIDEVRQQEEWRELREQARTGDTLALYGEQHRRIIAAIEAREPERARDAMRQHLKSLADHLEDAGTQLLEAE